MAKRSAVSRLYSRAVVGSTSSIAKILAAVSRVKHHNLHELHDALEKAEADRRPLITVSNHASTIDDPFLFGLSLPNRRIWGPPERMRWVWAAQEIIWANRFYKSYFSAGQGIAVVRGAGLDQPGVDEAVNLLRHEESPAWLHIFSEGKVNMDTESLESYGLLPFRWGIGHAVLELHPAFASIGKEEGKIERLHQRPGPIILPFYHHGFHKILPATTPYYPRLGQPLTTLFGTPMSFDSLLDEMSSQGVTREEARVEVTTRVEEAVRRVGIQLREIDEVDGHHKTS